MKKKLLFLGPPGAGKGTQANLFCKKYGLIHLSTGDLLRDEVSSGSVLGIKASEIMNKGELVSDELVLSIVEGRLVNINEGWLLDGFPRNVNQANSLKNLLEKIKQPLEGVILIKIADGHDESWHIWDTDRDANGNPNREPLVTNTNATEISGDSTPYDIDFCSNGFKIREDHDITNGDGDRYIYMAFAKNPFVTSTGVPTTAR